MGAILPVIAQMSPDKQSRLVHLDALADPEVLKSLFRTAEEDNLWRLMLPLVAGMSTGEMGDDRAGRQPRQAAAPVPRRRAGSPGAEAAGLVDQFIAEERSLMATIAAPAMPAEKQERFAEEVDQANLWEPLFEVARAIPQEGRAALAGTVQRIAAKRPELVAKLADLAEARGLGNTNGAALPGRRAVKTG